MSFQKSLPSRAASGWIGKCSDHRFLEATTKGNASDKVKTAIMFATGGKIVSTEYNVQGVAKAEEHRAGKAGRQIQGKRGRVLNTHMCVSGNYRL